jgi:hypothetical protein
VQPQPRDQPRATPEERLHSLLGDLQKGKVREGGRERADHTDRLLPVLCCAVLCLVLWRVASCCAISFPHSILFTLFCFSGGSATGGG